MAYISHFSKNRSGWIFATAAGLLRENTSNELISDARESDLRRSYLKAEVIIIIMAVDVTDI